MNFQDIQNKLFSNKVNNDISENPFYLIWSTIYNARLNMFELVEIPHLCGEINKSSFFYDMQCIKKAHQYMKQSISSQYYNDIKKNLKNLLAILIQTQQNFFDMCKVYQEDSELQSDNIKSLIVSTLLNYFQNPSNTKSTDESDDATIHTILISNFSTENNSSYYFNNN